MERSAGQKIMLAIYPMRVYNDSVKKNTPMGFMKYK